MCFYCLQNPCPPGCPNYKEPKTRTTDKCCVYCNGGIYSGEKNIENELKEYAHWKCIKTPEILADFLDCMIMEME